MSEPLLVDVTECGRLLGGLSRNSIFRLVRDEKLPHVKLRGRLLFPVDELRRWIEEQTVREDAA